MKKILAVSVLICCAVLLCAFSGCSSSGNEQKKNTGKSRDEINSYTQIMNEKLVSFTDCANAFVDSLETISDRKYAPSDSQIADIRDKLDRLKKACGELAGQKAPSEYSDAQRAIDAAMEEYAEAFDKCGALLDFYGTYDETFRKYKNPVNGSAKIEKKERALYDDFAQAMEKATQSFRSACEAFEKVQ